MLASLVKNIRSVAFPLGVAAGLIVSCWLFMYKTTTSPYLLLPRFVNFTRILAGTPEAEDPVWGAWDRTWRPPGDDEDWGKINCTVPSMRNPDDFYDYVDRRQIKCLKPVMSGGCIMTGKRFLIGEKWVCMDKRFNVTPGRCLALSFGIGRDFTFDDDMDKRFNCKVYAFDHTNGFPTHRRSPNIMFYNIGIGASDRLDSRVKMARYITLLKKLQLENAVIDYLKIDVEGDEYQFFSDIFQNTPNLLKNVKQIGMEIHVLPASPSEHRKILWKYFGLLRCYGFKVMFSEINPYKRLWFNLRGKERSCCYEVVWAREKQW